MSEVKTLKCDECGGLLPTNGGIRHVSLNLDIFLYCEHNKPDTLREMKMRKAGLDFCDLEHMTSYLAFAVTEHFMEPCGGEKDDQT